MEIYKLRDEVPARRKRRRGGSDFAEVGDESMATEDDGYKITDLRQGVKNPNRVNVYVNGDYAFSLDVAQVVELGVKIGRALSDAELAEMKQASEFGKAYQRALEWVLARPRSERELKDYLKRRNRQSEMKDKREQWSLEREMADAMGRGEEMNSARMKRRLEKMKERERYDFTDLIVERLTERGYVNDKKFAEWYVENRFVKKGVSRKRLAMELREKGVSADMIEDVLGGRNEEEELCKMIKRKRAKYDNEKLIAYLCRQGFSYDLVKKLVEEE